MFALEIKVGHIFNTQGPYTHPNNGRVVSNFIVQALKNRPITIYGDGEQTRSFCYVDDLIEAFILFMTSPESITSPLNLGNPHEFTIRDLAELEITLVGSKSKLSYLPLPTEYPKQCKPGLDKTTKLIDWKPRTQLISGLQKTIPYFDQLLRQSFKSKTWSSK